MNLEQYRAQAAAILMDPEGHTWDSTALDAALRQALGAYNAACPRRQVAVLTLLESGREIDLSSLPELVDVLGVDYPYRAGFPTSSQPGWRIWRDGQAAKLWLSVPGVPQAGEQVRLEYTACNTIEGLDNAAQTSVPWFDEGWLVAGAAGYAACSRALQRSSAFEPAQAGSLDLNEWGRHLVARFEAGLRVLRRQTDGGFAHWPLEDER